MQRKIPFCQKVIQMLAKQSTSHNRLKTCLKQKKKRKTAKKSFNFRQFLPYFSTKNALNYQKCNHMLSENRSSNRGLLNTHLMQ